MALAAVFLLSLALILVWRAAGGPQYGEAIALCPGPDLYGYTCTTEVTAEYINATNDTFLYADDGFVEITLPFPFTFYGQTYTTIQASSNGTFAFGAEGNANFLPACPNPADGVAPNMGNMVAPYWIDLDLTLAGFLEYQVVGTAPERIFVLEWDRVPTYTTGELVTFAVQLHEQGNHLFFFYKQMDMSRGRNGVVAIQAETQGLALTYSCFQPAVFDGFKLGLMHPETANPALTAHSQAGLTMAASLPLKGDLAELAATVSKAGEVGVRQLAQTWAQQRQPRLLHWQWADVTADGRPELIAFWQGRHTYPQLAIFHQTAAGQVALLWSEPLDGRPNPITHWELTAVTDRTGDGHAELVLNTGGHGRALFAWDGTTLQRMR